MSVSVERKSGELCGHSSAGEATVEGVCVDERGFYSTGRGDFASVD